MYSELSDYFYVWLRRALGTDYPREFGRPLVDDRREAVHNPGRGRDADFYMDVLATVFRDFYDSASVARRCGQHHCRRQNALRICVEAVHGEVFRRGLHGVGPDCGNERTSVPSLTLACRLLGGAMPCVTQSSSSMPSTLTYGAH